MGSRFASRWISMLSWAALSAVAAGCNGVTTFGSSMDDTLSTTGQTSPPGSPGSSGTSGPSNPSASGTLNGLHVLNGHIVNGANQIIQLHGVDHSYTEDSCTYTGGTFSDGHLTQADLTIMKTWNINAVRVPLNEDCLLGINGAAYAGATYQNALKAYVNLITSNGMVVILDLHWTAPGTQLSNVGQVTMADADHSPAFWKLVATTFASTGAADTSPNGMVVFDLFNEPFLTDWGCWIKGVPATGTTCPITDQSGKTYAGNMAGMAQLLQAVRQTGAQNVVIMGGLGYSSDFSQWLPMVQSIPGINGTSIANVAASWHIYSNNAVYNNYQYSCPSIYNTPQFSGTCPTSLQTAENDNIPAVLAAGFPFIAGETGMSANLAALATWYDDLLTWMDGEEQSYMAWSWNTDTQPVLLNSFTINPASPTAYMTMFGQTYQSHLKKF